MNPFDLTTTAGGVTIWAGIAFILIAFTLTVTGCWGTPV